MQNFINNNYSPDETYYNKMLDPSQNTSFNKVTHQSDKPIISKHIFAVDSRQRDYNVYKESNNYTIQVPDRYRNVSGIELKAAMLPRTEYNVNSSNKYIDFCIGDYISNISTVGSSYITVNGKPYGPKKGAILTVISNNGGSNAHVEVDIDLNSNIISNSYVIINSGEGYSQSKPPRFSIGDFKEFNIQIGKSYTAKLREGQYVIGGNPQYTYTQDGIIKILQSWVPSNLLCEVENALSNAILEDPDYCYSRRPWTSEPTFPVLPDEYTDDRLLLFSARLMSQYPSIDTYDGVRSQPNNFETNSCKFNRIYLSNCLIFKSDNLLIDTFSDGNFVYDIKSSIPIIGNGGYLLFCSLQNPLKLGVTGKFWQGLKQDDDVIINNIKLAHWEILNATGPFNLINSAGLLGFSKQNQFNATQNDPILINHANSTKTTTLIPNGLSYSTQNDYYLFGDPEYIVLSFRTKYGTDTISGINDRVDSQPDTNIDRVFACLIYDTTLPAVLQDVSSGKSDSTIGSLASYNNNTNGTFMNSDNVHKEVKQLTGNSGTQNVSYNRPPGQLKAMKGADFDRKIIEFSQPVALIHDLSIKFTKFTKIDSNNSETELYDFHGKEHLLLFEITCNDPMTGRRF